MKVKKLIFLCIFILILSIASVSASEDTNQTLSMNNIENLDAEIVSACNESTISSYDENQTLSQGRNNAILTDGTSGNDNESPSGGDYNALQKLIDDAEENSIINLKRNYTYNNEFDTINMISIDKNITINGNGFVIDGKEEAKIFHITAGSINITNITLQNGKTIDNGGAIDSSNAISNSNIDATFINNKAKHGGAIYFGKDVTNSNINATYINNTANYGGANYFRNNVINSNISGTFINNSAVSKEEINNGGANYFMRNVSNSNMSGTFINNSAAKHGGANYYSGVLNSKISGTYTNNSAKEFGGANYYTSILNSKISGTYTNNSAANNGGANYILNNITNSTISGTYINNNATYNGGANNFNNEVINSNITGTCINNTANYGGANNFNKDVINSTINGTYINNNATYNGGANNFNKDVINSTINGTYINNTANYGGANSFSNGVSDTKITGTYTKNTANYGGANIFINNVTNMTMTGTFTNNNASYNGGANYFTGKVMNSDISGTYANNTANYGGANYLSDTFSNSNITGTYTKNTANYGGANCFYANVINSNINGIYTKNTASYGGANEYKISVINSNISGIYINNTASYGGANHITNTLNANISGTYINNTATSNGGAGYYNSIINTNITGTYIGNGANERTGNGGANHITNTLNANISGTYINNTATRTGGTNYVGANITNTTISGTYINSRSMFGGAIYIDAENMSKLTISGTYINNTVTENNNAIINIRGKSTINAEIRNGIFLNNKGQFEINADKDGVVANNNWFGNNATNYPEKPNVGLKIKMDTWLYLNGTLNQSEFKFYLMSYNSTSNTTDNYDNTLIGKVNLTVTSTNTTVDKDYVLLDESIGLKIISLKNASITAQVENAKYTINIDDEYTFEIKTENITYGSSETISIILPEDVKLTAEDIVIKINNIKYEPNITDNVAKVVLLKPDADTYDVNVTFKGKDIYYAKNKSATFNVSQNSTYNLKINVEVKEYGKNTTINVNAPIDLQNNITIKIDNDEYSIKPIDGVATLTLNNITGGYHSITATVGDKNYQSKTNNTSINVPKAKNYPANLTIENNNAILELPEDATGNATLYINGKETKTVPVTGSKTTIPLPELEPGNYSITATYNGNNKYTPKTLNTTTNIPKIDNYTADINIGEDNVTVILPEDINGNLTVEVGNETFTVPVKNGVAVIPYEALPAGENNITVTYPGDSKYAEKSFDFNVTVEPKVIITAKDLIKYYGSPDRFVVSIKDSEGRPIAGQIVYITLNGKTYDRTTDNAGMASIGVNLNSGNYTAAVKVNETELTASITVLSTVNGTNIVKIFRNATQYYVTALDSNGNYLPENTEIEFNINGIIYKRKVTGDKGLVKLNINLNPNTYIITAYNTVTGELTSNNITVLSRLTENKNITMYEKNGTKYTVRVLDETGKAVGAGEKVTFNINGVFYTRTTDANGYAALNINLNPGNYIIAAMYGDSTVANNIEILPRLVASDLVKKYGTPDQFKAQLLDGKGNPVVGEKITFNINGVLYNRPTDADGFAKLNINLMPGKYVITSSYGSFVCGNTVTVNA